MKNKTELGFVFEPLKWLTSAFRPNGLDISAIFKPAEVEKYGFEYWKSLGLASTPPPGQYTYSQVTGQPLSTQPAPTKGFSWGGLFDTVAGIAGEYMKHEQYKDYMDLQKKTVEAKEAQAKALSSLEQLSILEATSDRSIQDKVNAQARVNMFAKYKLPITAGIVGLVVVAVIMSTKKE